ncbi:helix-turn-helix domain-containing protein [Tannerella serpentiformis]|uniref:helix-turn-helix domain-containing protein n=1 Tax=Tannerella serpentiformis TaxID=712710 RepID=UPI000840F09F|nr:helix-turn-helix domain-containing protein [Tannerella serpentiformis]AOH40604.1 helix-turn-helix domain-containing protein [Tannerella serpentiformis]AVV52264.1 helix-turn-helix domain-containing protein [Tannerella serpentiformis]
MKNFLGVNDRILYLIDSQLGGNKKKFAERIGFAPQVVFNIVSGRKSKPSFDVLEAIISSFDEISPEWLLTGKGAMLRGQSAPEVAPPPSEPAFPGFIEKIQELSVKVGRLEAENEHLRAAIEAKQKEIEAQQREIEAQRREIEARQKEIEDKERQIKLMRIDHLKKEEPDIHTQYLEPAHAPLPPENPVESAELLKSQPQEALFTP